MAWTERKNLVVIDKFAKLLAMILCIKEKHDEIEPVAPKVRIKGINFNRKSKRRGCLRHLSRKRKKHILLVAFQSKWKKQINTE